MTDFKDAVIEVLENTASTALDSSEIAKSTSVSPAYARKALAEMHHDGRVSRYKEGRSYVYTLPNSDDADEGGHSSSKDDAVADGGTAVVPSFKVSEWHKDNLDKDGYRGTQPILPITGEDAVDVFGDGAEAIRSWGVDRQLSPVQRTAVAYQDPDGYDDYDIPDDHSINGDRALKFYTKMLDPEDAADCCEVVPGYNCYDGELVSDTLEIIGVIDRDAYAAFGRESSPVLYVKTTKPREVATELRNMASEDHERYKELSGQLHDIADEISGDDERVHLSQHSGPEGTYQKVLENGGTSEQAMRAKHIVVEILEEDLSPFEAGPPDELSVTMDTDTYPNTDPDDGVDRDTYSRNDIDVIPEEGTAVIRCWWD